LSYIHDYMKIVSAKEAVSVVKINDNVFFQGAAMTLSLLIDTLCELYNELSNVRIIQTHTAIRLMSLVTLLVQM